MLGDTPYTWPMSNALIADDYTFPPGNWTHRSEGTQNWLLNISLSEGGEVRVNNEEIHTKRGELYLYPPKTVHDFGTSNRYWQTIWCHFLVKPEWEELLHWPNIKQSRVMRLYLEDDYSLELLLDVMKKLIERLHTPGKLHRRLALNSLEELLLYAATLFDSFEDVTIDWRIKRSLTYISNNLSELSTIRQLSEVSGMSPSRFQHLFVDQMNITPMAYLENQRIERAKMRLSITNEPVGSIAESVGFSNIYYFSNRFKKNVGISPSEFRNKKNYHTEQKIRNTEIFIQKRSLKRCSGTDLTISSKLHCSCLSQGL